MICPKCGASMPDDAQFCASCGAKVSSNTHVQNPKSYFDDPVAHSNNNILVNEPSKPPKKKSKKIIGGLIAAAIVFIVGSTMGEPSMSKNDTSSSRSSITTPSDSSSSTSTPATTSVPNSAGQSYESIFSDRYIVTTDSFFISPNYAAFAKVDADGGIDDVRYGYNDQDVIVEAESMYWYPITGMDEAAKQDMVNTLTNQYASANSSTIKVRVSTTSNYCVLTITLKGLDDPANVQAAVDAGMLTLAGNDQTNVVLSYSQCESALLAQDYAKK